MIVDDVKYSAEAEESTVAESDCEIARGPGECMLTGIALNRAEEVQLRLLSIGERLRQHAAEVGTRFDFTPQQALLIFRLSAPQTMGQIAESLGCDPSNVTGLSSRLEARGLLERVPDPNDRRTKWLTLTEEGKAVGASFREEIFRRTTLLDGLDARQKETLAELLRIVDANLNTGARG